MKKLFLLAVLLIAAGFTVYSQNAVIREVSGDVEIKHAGASDFIPARTGMEVAPNTIVSTGFRSSAVVAAGSNVIIVKPLTRLSLSEIQSMANEENLNLNLQAGRIRVEVKPPAGTGEAGEVINTYTSAAAAEGGASAGDVNVDIGW